MTTLVGKPAPDFDSPAVINGGEIVDSFTLSQFKGQKYVVLFFYPKDFTFVCPTEILAFQKLLPEFEKLNTQVIGVSTDSEQSHWAWLNLPKERGGIQGVTYPLVADLDKTISHNFGVLAGRYELDYNEATDTETLHFEGAPVAYRGTFLIDKAGIVHHAYVNNLPLGRNIEDTLRMVKALQFFEEKGEVCPADWQEGKTGMQATHEGVAEYLAAHA